MKVKHHILQTNLSEDTPRLGNSGTAFLFKMQYVDQFFQHGGFFIFSVDYFFSSLTEILLTPRTVSSNKNALY